MNDSVVNDEARHDRECQKQEALMKQARVIAQTAYEAGELDDWIEDVVDSHDSFKLAHALIQWIDSGDSLVKLAKWIPILSLRDFEANIEFVIEEKAKMIAEDF